jgi:hypothetical protein
MNVRDLNKKSEIFTKSIHDQAKSLQDEQEIEEVTTSSTDTSQSFDFVNVPHQKIITKNH